MWQNIIILRDNSKRWQNTNTAAKNYETLKIKRMLQQNEESKTHNTDNNNHNVAKQLRSVKSKTYTVVKPICFAIRYWMKTYPNNQGNKIWQPAYSKHHGNDDQHLNDPHFLLKNNWLGNYLWWLTIGKHFPVINKLYYP
jgi:hypothetical protein